MASDGLCCQADAGKCKPVGRESREGGRVKKVGFRVEKKD